MGLLKTGMKAAVAVKTVDVIHERIQRRQQEQWAAFGHQGGMAAAGVPAAPTARRLCRLRRLTAQGPRRRAALTARGADARLKGARLKRRSRVQRRARRFSEDAGRLGLRPEKTARAAHHTGPGAAVGQPSPAEMYRRDPGSCAGCQDADHARNDRVHTATRGSAGAHRSSGSRTPRIPAHPVRRTSCAAARGRAQQLGARGLLPAGPSFGPAAGVQGVRAS